MFQKKFRAVWKNCWLISKNWPLEIVQICDETLKHTIDVSAVNPDKSLISTMTMLVLSCRPSYLEKKQMERNGS